MTRAARRGVATAGAALVLLPGLAAAAPLGPSTVADASPPIRAAASFALVLVFGGAGLWLFADFVDRSIDPAMDLPLQSVVYGVAAHLVLGFVGVYVLSQIARLVPGLDSLVVLVVGLLFLSLAGLGFAVAGSAATELAGERRPWHGLVAVAAVVAAAWLVLPLAGGVAVWVAIVSAGVGGRTRLWFHASQTTVSDERTDG